MALFVLARIAAILIYDDYEFETCVPCGAEEGRIGNIIEFNSWNPGRGIVVGRGIAAGPLGIHVP